jgi:hypothetical protein
VSTWKAYDEPLTVHPLPSNEGSAVFLGGQRIGTVVPTEAGGWYIDVADEGRLNIGANSERAGVGVLVALFNGHLLPPGCDCHGEDRA